MQELTMERFIAGDKARNHGDASRYGVNALTKGYSVRRITKDDAARWAAYLADTSD
jgi:hypothetical protein